MKRIARLAAGLGLAAGPLRAMELSFEDLPRLVAERNGNARGMRAAAEAAWGKTGHITRSFLPTLHVEAGKESFTTGGLERISQPYGSAEARLNLYRGGRDVVEERLRKTQARISSAAAEKTYRGELAQARELYWDLAFSQEMIRLLTESRERNEKSLAAANRRINRGLTSESDRLEFQLHGLEIEEEIESFNHKIILIELALAPALNVSPGTTFKPKDGLEHFHNDSLLSEAWDSGENPDIMTLEAEGEALNDQARSVRRGGIPSLDIYGGYHIYTRRERDFILKKDRDDMAAGARISWFLFDRFQSWSHARALSRQTEAAKTRTAYHAHALEAKYRVAQEDLKHEHELLHSSEERITLAKKYLRLTLEEYDRGVKNSPDVLGAMRNSLGLQKQYAERRREYQRVRTDLLALLGK